MATVSLQFPVFRQGIVLSSKFSLSRETALRIANRIFDDSAAYVDRAINGIESASKTPSSKKILGLPIQDSSNDKILLQNKPASLRINPTIVIDFPVIERKIGNYNIEVRSCLTVCTENRQSKCWTRINLLDKNISKNDLDEIFDAFEEIANHIHCQIIIEYKNTIKSELHREKIHFEKVFTMDIRTVSGSDVFFDNYFNKVFNHPTESSTDKHDRDKIAKFFKIINSDIENIPALHSKSNACSTKSRVRQIGFSAPRSTPTNDRKSEVDPVNVVYLLKYDDKKATFTGIGYDPMLDKVSSLESLSHIASASVAVEFGGLF